MIYHKSVYTLLRFKGGDSGGEDMPPMSGTTSVSSQLNKKPKSGCSLDFPYTPGLIDLGMPDSVGGEAIDGTWASDLSSTR